MGVRKPLKKATGSKRMKQFGYHSIQVWFTEEDLAAIRTAARDVKKPVATWIREAVIVLTEVVKDVEPRKK